MNKFALDCGTMNLVSCSKKEEQWIFKKDRNVFLELPEGSGDVSAFMSSAGNKLVKIGDRQFVLGEESVHYATFFGKELNRPFKSGLINPDESEDAITILDIIIKTLLKSDVPQTPEDFVAYGIPGTPVNQEASVTYHKETLKWLIEKHGFKAFPVNEAVAIAYSELSKTVNSKKEPMPYTGLACSFGAGMQNTALVFQGIPVFEFSIVGCGDWIDEQVAAATGKPVPDITYIKETDFDLTVDYQDREKRYLKIYYEEMLTTVVENIVKFFNKIKRLPPQLDPKYSTAESLSVAIAGGTASPKGFAELLKKKIEENKKFPLKIKEIRVPAEPLYTVARGLYLYAQAKAGDSIK